MAIFKDIYDEGDENKTCAIYDRSAQTVSFSSIEPENPGGMFHVICETPSKFVEANPPAPPDPYPEPSGDYVENGTYFFSDFKLPWPAADGFCQDRGGWLADVRTPSENQLILDHLMDRSDSYW